MRETRTEVTRIQTTIKNQIIPDTNCIWCVASILSGWSPVYISFHKQYSRRKPGGRNMLGFTVNEVVTLIAVAAAFAFINISEEMLDRIFHGKLNLWEQIIATVVIVFDLRLASLNAIALMTVTIVADILVIVLRKLMPQMAISGISVGIGGTIILLVRTTADAGNWILCIITTVVTIIATVIIARLVSKTDEETDDDDEKAPSKGLTILGVCLTVVIVTLVVGGVVAYAIYAFNS